ncbi:MAG TPA: 50S ribosomal protein L20 [Alphaproteobacteria bacterium]|nr:50S ribosomal protein L20 [Alphaproteobacteria bacterium]
MPRARGGAARHRRKVKTLKEARGFRGGRRNRFRLAREAVVRSRTNAYRDRRRRKRDFRALWVTRLTAACRMRGISYSRFIYGLVVAQVELNRKMLSELAINHPQDFDALVELAKKHQPQSKAA